jgi:hypothetical protein
MRGWFATGAATTEIWGVLLIASPELRPIVERSATKVGLQIKRLGRFLSYGTRHLLRLRTKQRVDIGSGVSAIAALNVDVQRGFNPPSPDADLEKKVAYLLRQDERWWKLFNTIENQTRRQIDELRGELDGTASTLREHTVSAVRAVAEAELSMRLLGIVFVVIGLALLYAASIG